MASGFATLHHRGPDSHGVFTNGNVSLGHTRLKVIDVTSQADQPMISADRQTVLSFNGEVFNFQSLRKELSDKGYTFHSTSDTEVVLCAYREWGEKCFERFNGMFALAIADYRNNKVVVARDRFGIKPLYYMHSEGQFFFASELKMFLNLSDFSPGVNQEVLGEILTFRCVLEPRTLLDGVYSLEPGYCISLDIESPEPIKKCYWSISPDMCDIEYEDARREVIGLLKDSLRLRKISDVPHGLLLSGGLDSSILAALDKQLSSETLMTFSVGFDEEAFDESKYYNFVSQEIGTEHRAYTFSQEDILASFDKCIWHLEEPINHPHTPLIYLICREIKKHVTVLLSGEASDEIFAGYTRHLNTCRAAAGETDVSTAIVNSSALLAPESLDRLLVSETQKDIMASRKELLDKCEEMSFLQKLQYYDLKTYLPSLLLRLDKMTMGASVESRMPFMDWRLVQLAFSLPDEYKIRGDTAKAILKDVATDYFPQDFVFRPKIGFRTPFRSWLRNNVCFKEILLEHASPLDEYLNKDYISHTAERFFSGDDSFECSDVAWSVINMKTWCRLFIEGEGKSL